MDSKYLMLFFVWACAVGLHAQGEQSGFIEPIDKSLFPTSNTICLPEDGVLFFDRPNGSYAGRISHQLPPYIQVPPGQSADLYATIQWRGIRPTLMDLSYFFETSDDCYFLRFDRIDSGFVRILNDPYEAWVSMDHLQQSGFKRTSWMDFYGVAERMIAVLPGEMVPLRASPYGDSEILVSLDDEHFTIRVIPFDDNICCEGRFCLVEVIHYKENPCRNGDYSEENMIQIYRGWLPITDENGVLRVMHHSGGC